MASSSYYWRKCREMKAEAKQYKNNWKELEKIQKDVDGDFDNNVRDVNNALGKCEDKLEDGVRHLASFINAQSTELSGQEEASPDQDRDMSDVKESLENEIDALKKKEQDALDEAERYAELAREAEEEEAEERRERLASAVSKILGK